MTQILVRLAIFALLIILLRWFLKQVFVSAKKGQTSASGGNMVKDPVGGMYMDPRLAVTLKKNNGVFYFCSEECKNKFLKMTPGNGPGEPSQGS
jgi:uncharacterized protein